MNPDPFEQELARVPLRPPPPAWREEILASVLPASCRHERQQTQAAGRMPATRFAAYHAFRVFCQNHLSPGWSAVAAVWLVILGLNRLTASGDAPAAARPPLSPDYIAAVRAQQAELLRLAELDVPDPAPPPAPATTGPDDKPRPRGPRAHWPGVGEALEARLAALDCGGKRSTGSFGAMSSCEPGLVATRPSLIAATFLGALDLELGA